MRYLCVHCEQRWEVEGDETPARCPACMRATGVSRVPDESVAPRTRRPLNKKLLLALVTLLAAVGGYFAWGRRPSAGDPGELGPLSSAALSAVLREARVDAGELTSLLVAKQGVEAFARTAAGSAATPYDKAEAVTRALRARASALAFVPWSLAELRATPVTSAEQTLTKVTKDQARSELYPLELAALGVAALRTLGVPAMVAELVSVDGERAPLDPSGYLGYFALAVYPGEAGLGSPRIFDPYGGRALSGGYKHSVLRDPQVIGAALALRSLHEASYLADPRRALASSSHALALAGSLPSVRTARGMVVLAGKQVEQGLQEFAAARQLRSDPARLHNVATAELMTGDIERASKELHAAVAAAPDFASAHATLGSLAAMKGEPEQAQAELDQAERLAPDLTLVAWARAELAMRAGEREQALASARRALAARPSFDGRLRMGILLRQAGHYDELREQARALLAMAPAYREAEVRELISSVLGPAALDDAAAQPVDDLQVDPNLDAPRLELGSDSKLLEQGDKAQGPSLREQGSEGARPKLRLGTDDGLQLRLDR